MLRLLFLLWALGPLGCSGGGTKPAVPASIALSSSALDLTSLGETHQLTATVRDQTGETVTGATVTWSSSDPSIATVSPTGLVTAAANGSATITASVQSLNASADVLVAQAVESIVLSRDTVTLVALGDTIRIQATAVDALAAPVEDAAVQWMSSDSSIVEVEAGLVTAVGNGVGTIVATAESRSSESRIFVGRIAFATTRNGSSDLYLMNPDGSNLTRLTDDPSTEGSPDWSPDGSRIAFSGKIGGFIGIFVMDADGSNVTPLVEDAFSPAWSPDGSRIAFVASGSDDWNDVYVMDADGSNPVNLTESPGIDQHPAWSPDGETLAFESARDGSLQIFLMDADGSNPRRITNLSGLARDPAWSPDGLLLAFAGFVRETDVDREIYVMGRDGSDLGKRTDGGGPDGAPAWSPDGSRIAFQRILDTNNELMMIRADGSALVRLTNHPAADGVAAWFPR